VRQSFPSWRKAHRPVADRPDADLLQLRQHHHRQFAGAGAQFHFQQIAVGEQRIGDDVVIGPREFVERWLAQFGPRRLEQLAVQDHVALDLADALIAQSLQQMQQYVFVEIASAPPRTIRSPLRTP
jgi:hypothetical protein